jgi:hypothetical protein
MNKISLLLLTLFLGCATSMQIQHYNGPDAATLVFYRISGPEAVTVFIDGQPVAQLPVEEVITSISVAPGRHSVFVTLPQTSIPPVFLDLKPGEACHLRRTFVLSEGEILVQINKESLDWNVRRDAE